MVGVKTEIRQSELPEDEKLKLSARCDAFSRIAVWQAAAFGFLLCFVWCVEWLDIPALAFGMPPTPTNSIRLSLLTAGILAAAVVAIGHTYEQQRHLLRKLLETCAYCHRVKMPNGAWEHVEVYFIRHYPVGMQRGTCPACQQMLADVASASGRSVPMPVR
jgi:hypothetical protein